MKRPLTSGLLFVLFSAFLSPASALESRPELRAEAAHAPSAHAHGMPGMLSPSPMTREGSGTSWQPELSPMQGLAWMKRDWMLMFQTFATATYDYQPGSRGDDQFFSANMLMFMARRDLGRGAFGFRGMLSLEPATIGKAGYPLLLQTGETADGLTPLIDRQHPHDFLMELALSYSYDLSEHSSLFVYFGLPGEPAVGPSAFMHRLSGMEIPEAPITHHWLDSTHVTFGVGTLGYTWRDLKLEASIFTGREPNEDRWDFDKPRFDSYSTRLSYNPGPAWALQVSYAYLKSPEALEAELDVHRLTASATFHKEWNRNLAQTTVAWALNKKSPGPASPALLIETLVKLRDRHNLLARFENVTKDELFAEDEPLAHEEFNVGKLSLAYLHDFPTVHRMRWGLGGLVGMHFLPEDLREVYGDFPVSLMLWTRVKLQ